MEAAQHVLTIFERISSIPRGSGRESLLSDWLQTLAKEYHYQSKVDEAGNLLITIPASPGYETAPVVVLQGHMDMVCEKTSDSNHDFLEDAIQCIVDGDWMHADRTTLGADNGIAIALTLAIAGDPSVLHPTLELLFTVEEEVGLGGANLLKPGFITGKILVNLDSEDEGTFVIGCAGGQSSNIYLPVNYQKPIYPSACFLKVSGLRGGHSGIDINKHYGSANQLIARVLSRLQETTPITLMKLHGGTAHNAISREAVCTFGYDPAQEIAVKNAVRELEMTFSQEYDPVEQAISVVLSPADAGLTISVKDTQAVINLLMALPHGVSKMSANVEGFVETSNNLANIDLDQTGLKILTSQRSSVMSSMEELTSRITAIGHLAGAVVNNSTPYPGWQPDMNSGLLKRSIKTYKNLFGIEPGIKAIHAGLECGTIGSIYPGMEIISLGVTIENPHSPTERMYIPSVERVWKFLAEFLKSTH
ncbi:MAG: aminoacyl-histidine dipeptidase [Chloroflexota bacterium]